MTIRVHSLPGVVMAVRRQTLLTVAALLVTVPALAKKPPAPPPAAQAPALPPEVKKTTDAFVGTWKGEATITMPGAEPEVVPAPLECRAVANGRGAGCEMALTWSQGVMAASCLMAFDPVGTTGVHFMCVTTDGEVHDHRGRWVDAKHLAFDRLTWSGGPGGSGWEDLSADWPDANTMNWTSTLGLPDGSVMKFQVHATRK